MGKIILLTFLYFLFELTQSPIKWEEDFFVNPQFWKLFFKEGAVLSLIFFSFLIGAHDYKDIQQPVRILKLLNRDFNKTTVQILGEAVVPFIDKDKYYDILLEDILKKE